MIRKAGSQSVPFRMPDPSPKDRQELMLENAQNVPIEITHVDRALEVLETAVLQLLQGHGNELLPEWGGAIKGGGVLHFCEKLVQPSDLQDRPPSRATY